MLFEMTCYCCHSHLPFSLVDATRVWLIIACNACPTHFPSRLSLSKLKIMATLESWQIIAITFLGVVALLLIALMLLAVFLCLRKRELLCFKTKQKRTRSQRQQMEEERKLVSIYQGKQPRQRMNALKGGQRNFSDPFANRFSDPLHMDQDGIENFDITDWDNPLFDVQGARKRDAALTIQCWWRMIR